MGVPDPKGVPDPQGKQRFAGQTLQPKHSIADCSQTISPMLPTGEHKRAIPPIAILLLSLLIRLILWYVVHVKCCAGDVQCSVALQSPVNLSFDAHDGAVHSIEYSPYHRNLFLTAAADCTARIYSLLQVCLQGIFKGNFRTAQERGSVGRLKSPSWVQGRSPGRGSGGRSPTPRSWNTLPFTVTNFNGIFEQFYAY